ncbi:MAG: flavodoxin domain-containing protein [Firmicutes bacterium]|nr:flavodoxin domain-containing protein [Bacillota bacterium]
MKTLILYDTKYGFTEKCARYLHEKLQGSTIHKLSDNVDITEYDKILLGTYIYVGEINENASNFLVKNKNKLLSKKFGIFCAGLNKNEFSNALQKSIDPEIFYHAKIVLAGGRVILENLTFFEKRKIKKRINVSEDIEEFYPKNLDELLVF